MNIDGECIDLLSLIIQDSPKDRQLILCVLARANRAPTRIKFHSNTDDPTFYGYSNERIPYYLMGKGVLSNVPREGHAKRLISSHYLSHTETVINKAKNWDINQKLMSVSKFITLDNKTAYKDAEVFLVFRDKALDYIKDYATSHNENVSSFLGIELSEEVSETVTNSGVYYPQTIPDRTGEFEKLAREASVREHQRNLDDRNRREDAKTARILASTKDKYLHAVDLISEYAEMAKNSQTTQYADNGTTFSIPYYFFNFEDHIKVRDLLEAFLFKLKNAGCFENFNRSPATPLGSSMGFHKINLEKLSEYRNKLFKEQKNNERFPQDSRLTTAISLKDKEIKYDDKEARILIGDITCQLPPYKNEHYLCEVMFKKKVNKPIDWSVVYEKMSGDYEKHYGKTPKTREHWRTVYDTMIRINDRIKKDLYTTDNLFSWQELTIKRNF